ncbi:polymorphic toxin-type HINT domain-containing protein [Streptomyces sp. NPDC059828]|uniref:polymorphic toxin-type HINT domain-containing protein n=1 Tax=Streptomyces sp. NPDC059828 TaxID=3346965 RepID=UPI003647D243
MVLPRRVLRPRRPLRGNNSVLLDRSRRTRGWQRGYAAAGKAARGLLPLALVAGLVSAAGPAAADDPAPPLSDRVQVLELYKSGGPAVKSAAGAALTGSDEQLREYLATGQKIAEDLDLREAALTLVTDAGPGLSEAARKALDGTPEDLAAFMEDGWQEPLADDQRVEAARITEGGGTGLREAGDAAMRGSLDDIRDFLADGQYRQRDDDARVRVAQIEATGGPATKRATAAALRGSIEDVREFLLFGQHIARAQDQEHATISQLAEQTEEAGAAAEKAKKSAQEQAQKAKTAARLAKAETAKAAAETKAAKNDAIKAADAARRAAESSRRAAAAARSAIAAARAANAASQTAAIAAHNASTAALHASRAASEAWRAAASGKVNEKIAADAVKAAQHAEKIADAADAMAKTLDEANVALRASIAAIQDMTDAADSADAADGFAKQAGAHSAEAQAAAASARRHAEEARRASAAAQAHAADAAEAARQARDSARSAAAHARKAAEAARKAADHANDAQQAANRAKTNADEALKAAKAAGDAVKQAQGVQEKARKAEAEEIATRTKTQVNQARDAREAFDVAKAEVKRLTQEAVALDADFAKLAEQANQPGSDTEQIVSTGRTMALTATKIRGPWSRAAAEAALAGDQAAVVEYARGAWKNAEEQDERDQVHTLYQESPYEDVRIAAGNALKGDATQVHTFLTTGQYKAAAPDSRIAVARIADAGGIGVEEAAKKALDNPDPKALADFLSTTQHQARVVDDRVEAARLAENGTPEVQAAAETALASPDTHLRDFIESGQYRAQRRDQLTAAHVAQIQGLIATSSGIAARAYQDAYEAAKTAATAQGHADDATGHAKTANKYAAEAADWATKANDSADRAGKSAADAAKSADTARNAEANAELSATQANISAASAQASTLAAEEYARSAYKAAEQARQSAINAGSSAEAAKGIYKDAVERYMIDQYQKEAQERLNRRQDEATGGFLDKILPTLKMITVDPSFRTRLDITHAILDTLGMIPVIGEPADGISCAGYAIEGIWDFFSPTGGEDIWSDAGLACASMAPVAGWFTTPAKLARYSEKLGPKAKKLFDELSNLWKKKPSCPALKQNSFPAGTRVLMGDGSMRPIEQVRTGDYVYAADPLTRSKGARRVDATIYTPDDRDFTNLTLDPAVGGGSVTTTDHHPFWSENTQKWTDAADLSPGDRLLKADGTTAAISTVRHWKTLQPAYNLTVNDLHTYYVLAGATPVLVHNDGGYTPPPFDKILPGFPDAKYVGKGSPKSGGGYRARWSLPDGRILEWDSAHGTIEMWTNGKKNAKHMGEFDPESGKQLPGNKGRPVPGRKLGGC